MRPAETMRQTASSFVLGMILTVLPLNAISVYLFHDVDPDSVGQWNKACVELGFEFLAFVLVVEALFVLFTWIGRMILRLPSLRPNRRLGLILGVSTILLQYPIHLAGRIFAPGQKDVVLLVYLILCPRSVQYSY